MLTYPSSWSISTSFTFLNRSDAKMKSFNAWLLEVITCSFVPCHSFTPSLIHHGVHVVGIDNGRHIVLHRNVVNQIINQ